MPHETRGAGSWRWAAGALFGAWSGLVVLAGVPGDEAAAKTVNRIAAVVNDDVITEADIAAQLSTLLAEANESEAADATDDQPGMRRAVLRRLIEQQLMLQEAARAGIVVGHDEVERRVEALRSRFESGEAFRRSLAESELTEEQLRAKLRDQLTVQRLIETKVRQGIVVSPQEVAREIGAHPELVNPGDRIRAAHILVRVGDARSEDEARQLIWEIHRRLLQHADFAALAKQYSEDEHREQGGLMDWMAPGELMPELDHVLFNLAPGEVSAPIHTRLGFHLVKVEERQPVSTLTLMEANRAVHQRLFDQKFHDAFVRWIGDLTRKAYIQIPEAS